MRYPCKDCPLDEQCYGKDKKPIEWCAALKKYVDHIVDSSTKKGDPDEKVLRSVRPTG